MNPLAIFRILGMLLVLNGILLILPSTIALLYREGDLAALVISCMISFAVGLTLWVIFRKNLKLGIKDSFLLLPIGWLVVTAFAALPFVLHGAIPSYTDAFFETMSGLTTTGATILSDIDSLPHGLLFWRSWLQFCGGVGILLIMILVIPLLGVRGFQLHRAEANPEPGSMSVKLPFSTKQSILFLLGLYSAMTLLEALLLVLAGMPWFDALCHAFGTLATGGFSTQNDSMAAYNNGWQEAIVSLFMILGGMNFLLFFYLVKRDWEPVQHNTELKWYGVVLLTLCLLVVGLLWYHQAYPSLGKAIRHGTFQVVSMVTTTGFFTTDYASWPESAKAILFVTFFIGACAGSTTSGIKIIQMVILFRYFHTKLNHFLQPLAVNPIRVNRQPVDSSTTEYLLGYASLNFFFILGGGGVMALLSSWNFSDALLSVLSTVWNIGPGLGAIGPYHTYAPLPDAGKWFLSFCMLVGRLDFFTVLVIFHPVFWKR